MQPSFYKAFWAIEYSQNFKDQLPGCDDCKQLRQNEQYFVHFLRVQLETYKHD